MRQQAVLGLLVVAGLLLTGCGAAPADPQAVADTQAVADPPAAVDPPSGSTTTAPARSLADRLDKRSPVAQADGARQPSDALTAVVNAEVVTAFAEPDLEAEVVATFHRDPSYPQYLLALSTFAEYEAQDGDEWLEVMLPIRPNGVTGWVRVEDVILYQNRFRIEIDVSDFELTLFERGDVVFTTEVAIGTGDTPTPIGSFYTTVLYDVPNPDGPYGPYAFALSGFSEVLTSFNGGDGLIGIHGTNQESSLGTNVSHGCIRVSNERVMEMAAVLPLGTPVVIVE